MKHTEETLLEYPKVRKIIDSKLKIYTSNDGNFQITQFFSAQDSKTPPKRKLCIGLNNKKVKLYLHHVGLVTIFGSAPPSETVARELFAKWINDSTTFCVRSTDCLTYVDGINEVCKRCLELKKLKVFLNAINKPIPEEKNQKYTPIVLYKNSPFYQYCKNANIIELLGILMIQKIVLPNFGINYQK
ncbi:hypothetical protein F8M41_006833 [Gigaspora margarita]|uniref:Uncharacterized protein n=1 Tax=Gigaspora margarita TaxID=4874 RepID=A0A8H3X5S0_GIGMA|nr:hypothetical protein F8M41_006833 [Gigaspora margarita]